MTAQAPAGDHVDVDGYVTNLLDDRERRAVEDHLVTCAPCRAEIALLREFRERFHSAVPVMLLDGPAEGGGDLLVARVVGRVRAEARRDRRYRSVLTVGAAVVVLGLAVVAGALIGRPHDGPNVALPATTAPGKTIEAARDARTGSGIDPATGATLSVTAVPAAGWLRLTVSASGIAAGRACEIVAVAKDGRQVVAGSWLVSPKGVVEGTTLQGSALVAVADLDRIEVRDVDGTVFVGAEF